MDAKLHCSDRRWGTESGKACTAADNGWLLPIIRSAPTSSFAWSSIAVRRLCPKDKVATNAAIPSTTDEIKRNSRLRLRRLSRQAMRSSQDRRGGLFFFISYDTPPRQP